MVNKTSSLHRVENITLRLVWY